MPSLNLARFRRSLPFVSAWTTRSALLASVIVHGAIVGAWIVVELVRVRGGGESALSPGRPERPTELTMESPEPSVPPDRPTEISAAAVAEELPSETSSQTPEPTPPAVTTGDELRPTAPSRPDLLSEVEVTPEAPREHATIGRSAGLALAPRRPKDRPNPTASTEPPIALAARPPQKPDATSSVSVPPAPSGGKTGPTAARTRARPDPVASPKPIYPAKAEKKGIGGRVLLRVQVNHEGVVTSVVVSESSGHAMLDDAAVAAVKKWRFIPAEENGQKIATTAMVPIRFDPKL